MLREWWTKSWRITAYFQQASGSFIVIQEPRMTVWLYLLCLTQFQWKYVNNIYDCMPRDLRICRQPHFALTLEIISVAGGANYYLRMIKENVCFPSSIVPTDVFGWKIYRDGSCTIFWIQISALTPSIVRRQQT